jgi:Transposase DDE domain group 1
VKNRKQNSVKKAAAQAGGEKTPEPNKISASTVYDFEGKNLTPYGGLLPIITMLEKLGFQALVEELITLKRVTRAMIPSKFLLAIVMGIYVGFARLSQLRFIAHDPLLTGILQVTAIPPQSTLWRFLASLHITVSRQLLTLQCKLRERAWAAAHVRLKSITIDTDTTVHTLYGKQMGARKSYNPKNKGKKSYQPILTFLAETREYLAGQLRNGDRPTGKQIADHLAEVFRVIPDMVVAARFARADSGFYCGEAIEAYQRWQCRFVVVARKTARLLEELRKADWKPSAKTDADAECEFRYQPEGWKGEYRFVALRYDNPEEPDEEAPVEQYQLFAVGRVKYRVFVTNFEDQPIDWVTWFYNRRAGAENLIKEANNDAGLAAHPSKRFDTNAIHFQLAMLAYNLNCWLMLFQRSEEETVETLKHTTMATARLRFLFVAAKIWKHAGRTGISYSDHYQEQGLFNRLMSRLRDIVLPGEGFTPVVRVALE